MLDLAQITPDSKVDILEVGPGCGDAALYLHNNYPRALQTYTGININKLENEYASRRVDPLSPADGSKLTPRYRLIVADAGRPLTWPICLQERVQSQFDKDTPSINGGEVKDRWILAIDSLYQLTPSRRELLHFARHQLGASLMASDIVIADDASLFHSLLLRMLLVLMEIPRANILTQSEYMAILKESGYSGKGISVLDDSQNCFAPYVTFFKNRLNQLEAMGYAWDFIFVYRMGTWMIDMASRTGKLKHLLIVAKI